MEQHGRDNDDNQDDCYRHVPVASFLMRRARVEHATVIGIAAAAPSGFRHCRKFGLCPPMAKLVASIAAAARLPAAFTEASNRAGLQVTTDGKAFLTRKWAKEHVVTRAWCLE
ncbi:hypothetical protein ACFPU0_26170 [Pseudomonas sp. GCM10022186]|uniref:hypothetical protein n=1 Tax=Pseudomonas sp. GCM10022186 TaxID=3252650 RepID=UPI003608DDA6